MKSAEPIKIGKLNRTFGLKGEIRAFIEPQIILRWKKVELIKVMMNKTLTPLFIDEYQLAENGHCMFKFETIDDKTAADMLNGKDIFIDQKYLSKPKPYQQLSDFIGFELIDEKLGSVGKLEDVFDLPAHELGKFTYQNTEILFPITEDHILDTDIENKKLFLRLPDGMIDVYLNSK